MKVAQGLPAFPHIAVLGMMVLGATPAHAAGPLEVVQGSSLRSQDRDSRQVAAPRLTAEPTRDPTRVRNLKALRYNLGAATDPDSYVDLGSFGRETFGLEGAKGSIGVGLKVQTGTDRSPRIGTWSGRPIARPIRDYSRRSINLLSGSMGLFPRNMQSRFTISQRRIDVHIATAF